MTIQPVTVTLLSGVAYTSGTYALAGSNRTMGVQIYNWGTTGQTMIIGFGGNPSGYTGIPLPPGNMWEPPTGLIPQQDIYIRAITGSPAYTLIQYHN